MVLGATTAERLDSTLRLLISTLETGAQRHTAFEASVNDRFLAVDENARADRQELLGRFDRMEEKVEQRFNQVCEERAGQHDEYETRLDGHDDRLDAYDLRRAENQGRISIVKGIGGAVKWSAENWALVGFVVLLLLNLGMARDIIVNTAAQFLSPPAAASGFEPKQAEFAKDGLRGR